MPSTLHRAARCPPRVYWTRRLLVLGVRAACWWSCSRACSAASSDGSDARPTGRPPRPSRQREPGRRPRPSPTASRTTEARRARSGKNEARRTARPSRRWPSPTGPVRRHRHRRHAGRSRSAAGGSDVPIALNLRTVVTAGLHLARSPPRLADRDDHLRRRPRSGEPRVPGRASRPRTSSSAAPSTHQVAVVWNGQALRRGLLQPAPTGRCPGFYHVEAAALGGEPTDVQFELVAPTADVITKTARTPEPQGRRQGQEEPQGRRAGTRPARTARATPPAEPDSV